MRHPLEILGSMPVGDPNAIRAAARRIAADADAIGHRTSAVMGTVRATYFVGPAAERWRNAMGQLDGRTRAQGERLRALSQFMMRTAGEVEQRQSAWRNQYRRLEQAWREEQSRLRSGR